MSAHHDPLSHHKKTYVVVWLLLLAMTVITVWTSYHNFGVMNIVVAMGIASFKAILVMLYFMHLKYDNKVNQVVFAAAFFFLLIFVGLTLSDELFRPLETKAPVQAPMVPVGAEAAVNEQLRVATPELIAHGKEIFLAQCQTCHGATGHGDGPAATALNPKPRDFTSGTWKKGGTPSQVFQTVTNGIAGTGMASFGSLDARDRWEVVHFVRSLSPNTPVDTPETLAASGMGEAATAAPSAPPSVHLPIDFAIDRIVEEK